MPIDCAAGGFIALSARWTPEKSMESTESTLLSGVHSLPLSRVHSAGEKKRGWRGREVEREEEEEEEEECSITCSG